MLAASKYQQVCEKNALHANHPFVQSARQVNDGTPAASSELFSIADDNLVTTTAPTSCD